MSQGYLQPWIPRFKWFPVQGSHGLSVTPQYPVLNIVERVEKPSDHVAYRAEESTIKRLVINSTQYTVKKRSVGRAKRGYPFEKRETVLIDSF